MEEIKLKVRAFLNRFFRKHDLGDDEDIFALGYVNSLFAMQLVMFLEKDFSIKVDNNDLNLDNFRTINAISNLIIKKLAKCVS
jgi:acyl carrier protein